MEEKKVFENPQIEVVKFDAKDVITASFASNASYSVDSIKDFFKIGV